MNGSIVFPALRKQASIAARIRLELPLTGDLPTMEQLAVSIDISTRAIMRRLTEENTSHGDIIPENVREPDNRSDSFYRPPHGKISVRLGYSHVSYFCYPSRIG
jgi:hypothetical protein